MSEPTTEAGRRLLRQVAIDHPTWPEQGLTAAIIAIEQEAVRRDRERVVAALMAEANSCHDYEGLGCPHGTVDGVWTRVCHQVQREDVLAIVEEREPRWPKDVI